MTCLPAKSRCRSTLPDCAGTAVKQESRDLRLTTELGTKEPFNVVPAKSRGTEDVFLLSDFEAPWAALANPKLGIAARLEWAPGMLHYMWCWQHYGGNVDYPYYGRVYVVALEPFTSPVETLDVCAREGTCSLLRPGESANAFLEIGIGTEPAK